MELAKNGSLANVIKSIQNNNGPKEYTDTSRQIILVGIALGMKYLHDHNIIHRDLKTENILLDENFHPLITDFGMSKFFEEGHSYSQSQFGGTILYEAPEILKNMPYDRKVDVYSFGILMFEVVTDSPPYPDLLNRKISDLDFRYKVANESYRPKFNITINENLKHLIEECWSDDPKIRPSFDDIFKKLSYLDDHNSNQYFIGDVDVDDFKLYIDDIIGPVETILDEKSRNEESQIQKLIKENDQLKSENIKNIKKIKEYEEEIQKLKNDYMRIKVENEEYLKKIKSYEDEINKIKLEKNQESKTQKDNKKEVSNSEQEKKDDQNIKRVEEEQKLNESEELTVADFNSFPLKKQQSVSERMSKSGSEISNYFNKIAQITEYLLTFGKITDPCIEISSADGQFLSSIKEEYRILLRSNATEFLFNANLLNSTEFLNISSQFSQFSIEIKYPSDSYKLIIDLIQKILVSKNYKSIFTVAIFITGIDEISGLIYGNEIISYVRIDDCVTKIKSSQGPFKQFTSLIDVKIPSSLTSFEDDAFRGCKSLKKFEIPSTMTEIKWGFFRECSSLESIEIPSSVRSIHDHAFDECSSLSEINIPSSVTYIGNKTFADCTALVKISIPPSIRSFGRFLFYRCSSLAYITIPSSLSSIDEYAFGYCTSLVEVIIPPSVYTIGECAFVGCSSLKQVSIPSSVTCKGGIFSKCFNLEQITIPKVNPENNTNARSYRVIRDITDYYNNNFLISKSNINSDQYNILLYVKKCAGKVEIPSFITKIGSYTFNNCSSLTQVIIHSSVVQIGEYAFIGCSSLKEISLPPLTKIEHCTFKGCTSLTEVVIPSSVTIIEYSAFSECSSLRQVTIPSSVKNIESNAFEKCSLLTKVTIPSSVTSIENSLFCKCSSLTEVTIPSSVNVIKGNAFCECLSLKQITIPTSVQIIEYNIFEKCTSLTQVTIPSSLTEIGHSSFSLCSSLLQLSIPSSIKKNRIFICFWVHIIDSNNDSFICINNWIFGI